MVAEKKIGAHNLDKQTLVCLRTMTEPQPHTLDT